MKINFKQPRFILPLIFFPFILLFFWIFSSWGGKKSNAEIAKADSLSRGRTNEINPVLPGTSLEVSNQQIEGKFESYQQAYKHTKDASAVQTLEIADSSGKQNGYSSSYSQQDLKRIEAQQNLRKLQEQLNQNRSLSNTQMERIMNKQSSTKTPEEIIALARQQNFEANSNAPDRSLNRNSTASKDQMTIFREQMAVMDSMDKAKRASYENDDYTSSGASGESSSKKKHTSEAIIPSKDSTYKPLAVSLSPVLKSGGSNFNTIREFQPGKAIKAILDEDEKGYAGTRVRMRLLDDIYVGEELVPKNTYLYGIITGFQTSRVNITITQILLNNKPLPVYLDVFDNDGYLGLYVPGSNFREFTKEIGTQSTSGLSSIQTSNGQQDLTSSIVSKLFQSSGSTFTKLIHQNKASLKYNYIIYLKEKNK